MLRQFRNSKRIEIDFVKSQNKSGILRNALFIAGLSLFFYAAWQNFIVNQSFTSLDQELHASLQKVKPQLPIESESEKMMHQVNNQMAVAWPDIFASIEHHYQSSITFNSTNFDSRTNEVGIAGNADSLHNVIEFVESLKKEHIYEKVELLNHHQIKVNGRTVHSFEIHAKWQ